jgi:hypothetical protein
MHIKFLSHGTGDPHRAATYLLATHDHAGRQRGAVSVLRGNPLLVAEVASRLTTVHRYTSGVISWAREDDPSDAEIGAVIDDYERTAFAGLEADQYSWSVVQHTDEDGGKHVHVLAARVELGSGKALNIAPPGWEKTFDPLRDHWNRAKGWARPDDPSRARPSQPGRMRLASSAAMREHAAIGREAKALGIHVSDLTDSLAVEPDPKRCITDWLTEQILAGAINNREDLITSLSSIGSVTRVGQEYVSVQPEGHPRPLRLKGAIFGADFDAAAVREKVATPADLTLTRGAPDPQAAELDRQKLEAAVARRAAYNRERYPRPTPTDKPSPAQVPEVQEPLPISKGKDAAHVRARNHAFGRIERAVEAARAAVRGFITACSDAVRSSDLLGRAGVLAERSGALAQRSGELAVEASGAAERASGAIQYVGVSGRRAAHKELIRPGGASKRAKDDEKDHS